MVNENMTPEKIMDLYKDDILETDCADLAANIFRDFKNPDDLDLRLDVLTTQLKNGQVGARSVVPVADRDEFMDGNAIDGNALYSVMRKNYEEYLKFKENFLY